MLVRRTWNQNRVRYDVRFSIAFLRFRQNRSQCRFAKRNEVHLETTEEDVLETWVSQIVQKLFAVFFFPIPSFLFVVSPLFGVGIWLVSDIRRVNVDSLFVPGVCRKNNRTAKCCFLGAPDRRDLFPDKGVHQCRFSRLEHSECDHEKCFGVEGAAKSRDFLKGCIKDASVPILFSQLIQLADFLIESVQFLPCFFRKGVCRIRKDAFPINDFLLVHGFWFE